MTHEPAIIIGLFSVWIGLFLICLWRIEHRWTHLRQEMHAINTALQNVAFRLGEIESKLEAEGDDTR